jgi:predicted AlkP superfamily pyrophosphatase or phosphodiesterase
MQWDAELDKKTRAVLLIIIVLMAFGFSINFIAYSLFPTTSHRATPRVILISIDSGNSNYLSEGTMPKLFSEIMAHGVKFKSALTVLAAETQHAHTSMLTGAFPNRTGLIGNGLYFNDTGKTVGVLLDPSYRLAETIFEAINRTNPALKTAFISGKWRLPPLLSQGADIVLASAQSGFTIPKPYLERLGAPITYVDGDAIDPWVMNALIDVIKHDDPDFIFVNLAWTDVWGHYCGAISDYAVTINRQLAELDNLFMRLFTELKAMGEYDNTLFAITADHGMETVDKIVDIHGYLEAQGIQNHIHVEGGSGFIFLQNASEEDKAVNLLSVHPDIAVVVPRENMSQYPYCLDTFINRTGHIYISMREHTILSTNFGNLTLPVGNIGSHGGIATQDVIMGWMGPNITCPGYELLNVPNLVDIVPTICYIMGWTPPAQVQGRVLYEILE